MNLIILGFEVNSSFLKLPLESGPQRWNRTKQVVNPMAVLESPVAPSLKNGWYLIILFTWHASFLHLHSFNPFQCLMCIQTSGRFSTFLLSTLFVWSTDGIPVYVLSLVITQEKNLDGRGITLGEDWKSVFYWAANQQVRTHCWYNDNGLVRIRILPLDLFRILPTLRFSVSILGKIDLATSMGFATFINFFYSQHIQWLFCS